MKFNNVLRLTVFTSLLLPGAYSCGKTFSFQNGGIGNLNPQAKNISKDNEKSDITIKISPTPKAFSTPISVPTNLIPNPETSGLINPSVAPSPTSTPTNAKYSSLPGGSSSIDYEVPTDTPSNVPTPTPSVFNTPIPTPTPIPSNQPSAPPTFIPGAAPTVNSTSTPIPTTTATATSTPEVELTAEPEEVDEVESKKISLHEDWANIDGEFRFNGENVIYIKVVIDYSDDNPDFIGEYKNGSWDDQGGFSLYNTIEKAEAFMDDPDNKIKEMKDLLSSVGYD